jgi:hypothetical protein
LLPKLAKRVFSATPARDAIWAVVAPSNPFSAKTPSAASSTFRCVSLRASFALGAGGAGGLVSFRALAAERAGRFGGRVFGILFASTPRSLQEVGECVK